MQAFRAEPSPDEAPSPSGRAVPRTALPKFQLIHSQLADSRQTVIGQACECCGPAGDDSRSAGSSSTAAAAAESKGGRQPQVPRAPRRRQTVRCYLVAHPGGEGSPAAAFSGTINSASGAASQPSPDPALPASAPAAGTHGYL